MSVRLARREEQGNLITVVLLTVVVVLFGVAFIVRATGDLQNSRDVTNTNAAREQALAGLSDALFRLDQEGASPSAFCVGSASQCTVSSVPGAPSVQYTVKVPNNSTTATVLSEGTVNGVKYAIQATVSQVQSFPFGIFAG
jgi:Tfp pilus assembly protein PilX